jgi:hypothetical protein
MVRISFVSPVMLQGTLKIPIAKELKKHLVLEYVIQKFSKDASFEYVSQKFHPQQGGTGHPSDTRANNITTCHTGWRSNPVSTST